MTRRNQREFEYCLNQINTYYKIIEKKNKAYIIDHENYVRMTSLLMKWEKVLSNK